MNLVEKITRENTKNKFPNFGPGDTLRVHQLIKEGDKERVQVFEGVCTRRCNGGSSETFTVRKMSYNVGVERIYPLHSPKLSKIEVKQRGRVRRARLYYLRGLRGKAAKISESKSVYENQKVAAEASSPADDSAAKE